MSDTINDAILANIFLAIQNRLKTEVPELKFIDLDTGQLEYKEGERPAVLLPCALIDFISVDYGDLSTNAQIAEPIAQIRIGVDPFTQATHYFSQPQISTAINFFNIEHRVNQALHGWCNSQYFTPMSRTKVHTENRSDKLRVRPLHYKFGFTDFTAMPVAASTIPRPDLVVDVDTPLDGV